MKVYYVGRRNKEDTQSTHLLKFEVGVFNPEVVGSNPTPATKTKIKGAIMLPFNFLGQQPISFTTETTTNNDTNDILNGIYPPSMVQSPTQRH